MNDKLESQTALSIAFCLSVLSKNRPYAQMLSSDQVIFAEKALALCSPFKYRLSTRAKRIWFINRAVESLQRFSIPGLALHWVVRKAAIREKLKGLLASGEYQQFLLLAGGFDSIAYEIAKMFPEVECIEVDHPATQNKKIACLRQLPIVTNHQSLPFDFNKGPLTDLLIKNDKFCGSKNTLMLAEGLFMYLEEPVVYQYLELLKGFCSHHSTFLFTYLEKVDGQGVRFQNQTGLVNFWLSLQAEPFIWAKAQSQLRLDLKDNGFEIEAILGSGGLMHLAASDTVGLLNKINQMEIAEGERLAVIHYRPQSALD